MQSKYWVLAAGLAFTCVLGCQRRLAGPPPSGQGQALKDYREIDIYIYSVGGQCFVDVKSATLWIAHHQKVVWVSDDKKDYHVDFGTAPNSSPFAQSSFPVSNGQDADSGDVGGTSGTYYPYTVSFGTQAGSSCLPPGDPGFYVK